MQGFSSIDFVSYSPHAKTGTKNVELVSKGHSGLDCPGVNKHTRCKNVKGKNVVSQ
jgi:hypothetical protein